VTRPAVTTAVDAVAAELRAAVLAGRPAPGERLREEALAATYQVARHTLRAALRVLAAERLVVVEPHRGARVAHLDGDELGALFELRTALEVEAARLVAVRGRHEPAGRDADTDVDTDADTDVGRDVGRDVGTDVGTDVDVAARELDRLCRADPPDRAAVDAAHLALHHALVAAAGSPRITQAHAALAAEQRLALLQSRTTLGVERMAEVHRQLLAELRAEGPEALRRHLAGGRAVSLPATPGT